MEKKSKESLHITRIYIDGFGQLHDRSFELSAGLNLIYGANEAGKTTIMEFIRAIFYGFRDGKSKKNRYLPAAGGRLGGFIELEQGSRRIRIQRYKDTKKPELLEVTIDGTVYSSVPPDLFGGISRKLYENLFAIGLDELNNVIARSDISGYIYSAGMGATGISISGIKQDWRKKREELFKPKGSKVLNNLLKNYRELKLEKLRLEADAGRYGLIVSEIADKVKQITLLTSQLDTARANLGRFKKLCSAYDDITRLTIVSEQLTNQPVNSLEDLQLFPDQQVYNNILNEKLAVKRRISGYRQELREKSRHAGTLHVDESLMAHRELIESLSRFETEENIRRVADGKKSIAAAKLNIADAVEKLRAKCEPGLLDVLRNVSLDMQEVRGRAMESGRHIESCRSEIEKVAHTVKNLYEQVYALDKKISGYRAGLEEYRNLCNRESLEAQKASLELASAAIEKHGYLKQEVTDKLSLKNGHMEEKEKLLKSNQRLRTILTTIMAALLICGISAGYLVSLAAGAAVVITSGLAIYYIKTRKKVLEGDIKVVQSEVSLLDTRIDAINIELAAIDDSIYKLNKQFGNTEILPDLDTLIIRKKSVAEDILLADEKKALLAKLHDSESDRTVLKENIAGLQGQADAAKKNKDRFKNEWLVWLESVGISVYIPPAELSIMMEPVEKIKSAETEIKRNSEELAELMEKRSVFISRLNMVESAQFKQDELLRATGYLVKVRQQLSGSLKNEKKRSVVNAEVKNLGRNISDSIERLREIRNSMVILYCEASKTGLITKNSRDYCRNLEKVSQLRKLFEEAKELNLAIKGGLNLNYDWGYEQLESVQDKSALEQQVAEIKADIAGKEERLKVITEKKGKLLQRARELETSTALEDVIRQMSILKTEFNRLSAEWTSLALAEFCTLEAEKLYEKGKQLPAFKTAGLFFEKMTCGKYRSVIEHYDYTKEMEVERPNGKRLSVSHLSRGTKEQLYLSVRFAYAVEFARESISLPFIMDDLLVNFDSKRNKGTISAITEIAKTFQVMMFSCHEQKYETCCKIYL